MQAERDIVNYLNKMAKSICQACGENPMHAGDARGNNYRWQDYLEIAAKVAKDMGGSTMQAEQAVLELKDTVTKLEKRVSELERMVKPIYSKHQRDKEKAIMENSVHVKGYTNGA